MYYNQELGLCIEFGPVRVDSVRRGGAPPWIKPPCAGSRRHGLLPGLLVIACYLLFTPSSLKYYILHVCKSISSNGTLIFQRKSWHSTR